MKKAPFKNLTRWELSWELAISDGKGELTHWLWQELGILLILSYFDVLVIGFQGIWYLNRLFLLISIPDKY